MLYSSTSGDRVYGDTFFNRTLELAEPEGSWEGLSLLAAGAAAAVTAAYFFAPAPKLKAAKPAASEVAKPAVDKKTRAEEWLAGTPAAKKSTPKKKAA